MSAEAAPVERSDIPPAAWELAGDLLPDAPRLAREMNEHLFATMQELRGCRQRRCLLGGIRAARGGGSRRLCAARGDPGRHRATRPRPRRLPALARRGAGGRARRVAALAGGAAAAVTRCERVESLLASDFPRARAFVAARLGPLAAATEPAARLRETVLAFLAANGSGTRVLVGTPQAADRVRSRAPIPGRRMLRACRPTLSNQERTWA